MKKQSKTTKVLVSLPMALLAEVDQWGRKEKLDRTKLIRKAVGRYIEDQKGREKIYAEG